MSGDAGFQGDKVTPAHSPPVPPPCSSVALASFPGADMGRDPPGRWHPFPPSWLLHLPSTLSLSLLWTSQRPPDVFPGPSCVPPSLSSSPAQKCAKGPALLRAHPRLLTAPDWSPSSWPLHLGRQRTGPSDIPAPHLPALSPSLTDLLTAPSGHTWPPRWAHPPPHLGTAQPHPRALRGCRVLCLLRKSSCPSLHAPHLWQHVSSLADGDWCSAHGQTAGSSE